MKKLILPLFASFGLLLSGCVGTGPNTQRDAVAGGALGALAGAIIGNNTHTGSGQGALIGGALGAIAGGTLGNAEDHQQGKIYGSRERAETGIFTETLPPEPSPVIDDPVACPGYDYIWIPGCWVYSVRGYEWHRGYWTLPPDHYHRHYVPPHWERSGYGHIYVRGYWR